MQKEEPTAYGITASMGVDTSEMRQCWKSAIRELKLIPDSPTPALKLQQVGKAIEIVQHSFELFRRG
jgi:hypothetical protein